MRQYAVSIRAMWFQPEVGMKGYYGVILSDGTPVALCSKEKFDLGPNDSLRSGWANNLRIGNKTIYTDIAESVLKRSGLLTGSKLELQVPPDLMSLTK